MFSYTAYGLTLHSDFSLPALASTAREADVTIRLGSARPLPLPPSHTAEDICLRVTEEEVDLYWEDVGRGRVRHGREIVIEPLPGVDERVVRLYILGSAMGALLHQRGLLALHASAVVAAGGAIAFIGEQGAGKSTTAAALHARGRDMLADDITAVDVDHGRPMVRPGFPQFKLWSESVASLGEDPERLPRLHPDFDKRAHRLTHGFAPGPAPLRCIYILDEGPSSTIEAIPPQEALSELLDQWYGARFGPAFLHATGLSAHFLRCAHLANTVPCYRLFLRDALSELPDVVQLVEHHADRLMG